MDRTCWFCSDFSACWYGKSHIEVDCFIVGGMNTPKCPACGRTMTRYGHSASGAQRWRCTPCNISQVSRINSTAKHLDEFLAWLLGRRRQADLPGGGRSFRRRCEPLWQLWPFSPIIDEVHDVIFVDGIHLGRNAVVLIAQTKDKS